MALSTCFSHARIFLQNDMGSKVHRTQLNVRLETRHDVSRQSLSIQHFLQNPLSEQSLGRGCMTATRTKINTISLSKKRPGICSCWMVGSQIASNAFTLGTAAVLPFYTLMVFAPKAEMTKKAMDSSIPYVMLGLVYAYLLYLSWTPDTIRLMFASKYWLPELPGIAKMFSNEMTLSSAWIHLLIVDLFAARRIYHDGLENKIETRHSVSMCLLVCPIGILMHTITKALTRTRDESRKHNV